MTGKKTNIGLHIGLQTFWMLGMVVSVIGTLGLLTNESMPFTWIEGCLYFLAGSAIFSAFLGLQCWSASVSGKNLLMSIIDSME